jgi:hypothetical protein
MSIAQPQGEELYREEIPVTPIKILVVFEVLIGFIFLGLGFIQIFSSLLASDGLPAFFWFFMAAVFFASGWVVSNFSAYHITMVPDALILAFGRLSTVISFENINAYSPETGSSLLYGGWGFRIALTKDGWVKAYTLFRKPKIDLTLKTGRYRHIIFSTDQPDNVMEILRERLKNAAGHVRSAF